MIAIITEKPSVARDIAAVLQIDRKGKGYLYNDAYMITWALGHLVTLALPGECGNPRLTTSLLPFIPAPFRLIIRRKKKVKGSSVDNAAYKQLKVIEHVFNQCDSIISATDAGREGELIFRWIYDFLECKKPFQRLWINSMAEQAIKNGFASLRDGSEFDNLYKAADCRAKADYLVGINASQALCFAYGAGNNSIGRVQTPTLAMICSRYLEHVHFKPADYWQLKITVQKDGLYRHFTATEADHITDRSLVKSLHETIIKQDHAVITKIEKKTVKEQAPLLYDLTTLQRDANVHYAFSAEYTLEITQRLYESRLITYPRTGSRHIPQDVLPEIPKLLKFISKLKEFSDCPIFSEMTFRSVKSEKVTDHHAILLTGIFPSAPLCKDDLAIYNLIAGRILESFAPECVKEITTVEALLGEMTFTTHGTRIASLGWRAVYNRPEKEEPEKNDVSEMPAYKEGETVMVISHNLVGKKTKARPLHTEATLLGAMEHAGRELSDDTKRQALKGLGIGTAATRAAIIQTLFERDYIEREEKSLVLTEKGMMIYKAVKDLRIADVELSASWEKSLSDIEDGKLSAETFMQDIEAYTRQITEEIQSLKIKETHTGTITCPKCGTGKITITSKAARCDNDHCDLHVFRQFLNKKLTEQHLQQLLSGGSTKLIKRIKGKKGNLFDACVTFDENFHTVFTFPNSQRKK